MTGLRGVEGAAVIQGTVAVAVAGALDAGSGGEAMAKIVSGERE